MKLKLIVITLILTLALGFTALAAQPREGFDILCITDEEKIPQETWDKAETLMSVPREIYVSFSGRMGTIHVTDSNADFPEISGKEEAAGCFLCDGILGPDIYIAADIIKDDPEMLAVILAHELGHFVYNEMRHSLSAEYRDSIEEIADLFPYAENTNERLAYAFGYVWTDGRGYNASEIKRMRKATDLTFDAFLSKYQKYGDSFAQNAASRFFCIRHLAKVSAGNETYWIDPQTGRKIPLEECPNGMITEHPVILK